MTEPNGRQAAIALAGITLVAIALRVYRIGEQSAWIDEAFTIHAAVQPWDGMMAILIADYNHPPLHTMLVRWWFDLVGVGVVQARLLSAIFGVLAVPAIYWLGALLVGRRAALFGALLLSISQLGIVYSQEARGYSLVLVLTIITTAFFARAFRFGRARDFVLFVLAGSVAMYVHYYTAFALISLALVSVIFRRRSAIPLTWWAAGLLAGILIYLPWLTSGVIDAAIRNPSSATVGHLSAQLGSPIYALNWFNNGKIAGVRTEAPLWAFAAGFVIFTLPALAAFRFRKTESVRMAVVLLALAAQIPVLAVVLVGLLQVVYDVRHVAFAIAPYYLLVARGVTTIETARLRIPLVVVMVAYSMLSLRADYFIPYKDNNRDAITLLAANVRQGDCTVFSSADGVGTAHMYWASYHHGRPIPTPITLEQAAAPTDCARVWLLWDTSWWKPGPDTYAGATAILNRDYRTVSEWSFAAINVALVEGR